MAADTALENDAANRMCIWLDGVLRAEREAISLEMEKRHDLLMRECIRERSTLFAAPTGIVTAKLAALINTSEAETGITSKTNGEEYQIKTEVDLDLPPVQEEATGSSTPVSPTTADADVSSPRRSLSGSSDGRKRKSAVFSEEGEHEDARHFMHGLVLSPKFELIFDILIVANTVVMALESQYDGFTIGQDVKFPHYNQRSADVWPGMKPVFTILDLLFGVIFTLELFMKVFGLGQEFVFDAWNLFDAVIVLGWMIDAIARDFIALPIDPMMLRLARLARLMRLLKLLKTLKGIDPLFLMVTTLKGSMAVLFWVFILMLVVQTMSALLMNQILVSYYLQEDNSATTKILIFKYFGTFSRSMLTMFEITLGNWVNVARVLQDGVSEWFIIFSLVHKLSMGFAVVGVINGIFIQETFKVAACDDTLMLLQKQRAVRVHTKKMQAFFEAADDSGDGFLDQDEFKAILEKAQVRTWLSAQDLDATDADSLFALLNKSDQGLSAPELVKGVSKLKGASRSIDLTMLIRKHDELCSQVQDVQQSLANMGRDFSQVPRPPNQQSADVLHIQQIQQSQELLVAATTLFRDMNGAYAELDEAAFNAATRRERSDDLSKYIPRAYVSAI